MDTNSRIWYWHLAVAALWPLVVALVVVQPPSGVWLGVGVVGLIAMAGSLVGYFEEAKHFDGGEGWAPRWKLWTAAHVVAPLITAPLYLAQRWRRVGLQ
jgi:hypothetical protein